MKQYGSSDCWIAEFASEAEVEICRQEKLKP